MKDQEVKTAMRASSNVPYLIAVVVMAVFAIAAISVISIIRPERDNSAMYVLILGFGTSTTAAILAFMKSQETHLSVNSRLDDFIRNADRSARAEGELAGRAVGREQAEKRTDTLKENSERHKTDG